MKSADDLMRFHFGTDVRDTLRGWPFWRTALRFVMHALVMPVTYGVFYRDVFRGMQRAIPLHPRWYWHFVAFNEVAYGGVRPLWWQYLMVAYWRVRLRVLVMLGCA